MMSTEERIENGLITLITIDELSHIPGYEWQGVEPVVIDGERHFITIYIDVFKQFYGILDSEVNHD